MVVGRIWLGGLRSAPIPRAILRNIEKADIFFYSLRSWGIQPKSLERWVLGGISPPGPGRYC